MGQQNEPRLWSGIVAGVAGGLFASWIMNEFVKSPGPKIIDAVASPNGRHQDGHEKHSQSEEPKEDATMKTADAIVSTVTGGRHLSFEEKQKGGPIVHYAFGAIMGGVYGALSEFSPAARAGFGTAFAGALFAGADLVAVPALNLSGAPADAGASTLATPFAAHMVYGLATEAVRRLVRAVL